MEISWYEEWLDYTKGEKVLPEPLKPQEKWDHPYMKIGFTAAMHKGPYASDVFNNIWGTFTFGPDKSFYLGTYRGFIKVSSD